MSGFELNKKVEHKSYWSKEILQNWKTTKFAGSIKYNKLFLFY